MTLANWVREQTGSDPAPELRGTYATDAEWQDIVKDEGSLVALIERLALGARLHEVNDPAAGDIGVLFAPLGGEVGAIFAGPRWVVKARRGMIGTIRPPLAAWGLR